MAAPADAKPPSFGVRRRPRVVAGRPPDEMDDRPAEFRPPRPLRDAAFVSTLMLVPLAFWLAGLLERPAALGFGLSIAVIALLEVALGAYGLRRVRALGDGLLRANPGLPPVSGLAVWRAVELTSRRERRRLAAILRQRRREAETCTSLGVPGLEPATVDEIVSHLLRLEAALAAGPPPLSPLELLELRKLAAHEASALYHPERAGALLAGLTRVGAGLDPR